MYTFFLRSLPNHLLRKKNILLELKLISFNVKIYWKKMRINLLRLFDVLLRNKLFS